MTPNAFKTGLYTTAKSVCLLSKDFLKLTEIGIFEISTSWI